MFSTQKLLSFSFSILFLANVSQAQTPPTDSAPVPPVTEAAVTPQEHYSVANRTGKSTMLLAQLLGYGPSHSGSYGLSAGYFLNRNQILSFEITTGDYDSTRTILVATQEEKYRARSAGVHFKHFVGNAFYYRAGIDYRNMRYSYQYSDIFSPGGNIDASFTGNSWALTVNIGHQWQWENFTLGCDWVGLTLPFAHAFSKESFSNNATATTRARINEEKEDVVKSLNLNLLRFYLGASF